MNNIVNYYPLSKLEHLTWFSKENKRFFNSRWGQYGSRGVTVINGEVFNSNLIFFVSSEKFSQDSKRLYTIRRHNLTTGETITVGEFQQYKTKKTAERYAEKYAREFIC